MIRILKYKEVANEDIFARVTPKMNVEEIVAEIIEDVRKNGDQALFAYGKKFDKADLASLAVSKEELEEAMIKYIEYYNNERIMDKTKGLSPLTYRQQSFVQLGY